MLANFTPLPARGRVLKFFGKSHEDPLCCCECAGGEEGGPGDHACLVWVDLSHRPCDVPCMPGIGLPSLREATS